MNQTYTVSRDDPMPNPDVLIKDFDDFASEVILTEHPYKLGTSVDSHRIDFSNGSIEVSVWTESRLNGLFYHIGRSYQEYSIICQNIEVEAQFRRIFMLALVYFSKYPEIDIDLKPDMRHYSGKDVYLNPLKAEKRKKYFKTAFWKTDWKMPENLDRLYKQFRPWAASVRTKIKRAEFEVQVDRFKGQLKEICPHFSREELVQIVDETIADHVLGV